MRIVVATFGTMPGYSGGWTTPLDLLQPEHDLTYVSWQGQPGRYVLEGVPVRSPSTALRLAGEWPFLNRLRFMLRDLEMRRLILSSMSEYRADFVLCLDELAGAVCMEAGLPYAMRFHSQPVNIDMDRILELMESALFSTCSPGVDIPGCEVLPHNVDLSRFRWTDHARPERALFVSSLNRVRMPEVFVRGVALAGMRGTVVGDGPLRDEVIAMCGETAGLVEYREPLMRLELPPFMEHFQIGVAAHQEFRSVYQMKVNEYLAAGLFALVMPWTHLAREAPALTLTFTSAEELAERLVWLRDNWAGTLETRRDARAWILEHYSIEEPRERFREILRKTFGES